MASVREWVGARAAIGTVFVAAVLSVAIGIFNTSSPAAGGVLAPYIPDAVRITAGFTGTLTGFPLLASVFGLRRRYRAAWYSTTVMLPVTAAQELIQSPERAAPLVGLSLISLALLVFSHRASDRDLDLAAMQLSALLAITDAQTYATAGAWAFREQSNGIDTLFDAFYLGVVTGSTVGYGDICPQTTIARLFSISALFITAAMFAVVLGVLLTSAIEARLTKALGRMTESQLDVLEKHVLVLGYGELTEPILKELGDRARVVIITPDEGRAKRLTDRGYDVVTDGPSNEGALQRTRINAARSVVVATNNDAEDALTIPTARQLSPDVYVVAAATQRENGRKLRRVGANTAISPTALGGHFLAESAVSGSGLETIGERLLNEQPVKPTEDRTGEAGDPGTDDRN